MTLNLNFEFFCSFTQVEKDIKRKPAVLKTLCALKGFVSNLFHYDFLKGINLRNMYNKFFTAMIEEVSVPEIQHYHPPYFKLTVTYVK